VSDDRIVRAAMWGTAVFVVVAVAAAAAPDAVALVAVFVDLLLFVLGCAAFVAALVRAAERSRRDDITLGGLFWLTGSAPTDVRHRLLGALGIEIAVALATAGTRPFTGLAFGVLVPVYGLGLTGLWAARHGTFGPRA
jgi:hypothetical protein